MGRFVQRAGLVVASLHSSQGARRERCVVSQITERYVRNFIRGFNEAFADLECDDMFPINAKLLERRPNSGMVIGGGTGMQIQVGDRTAWFAEDGVLCGPPELLRELDAEKGRKEKDARLAKAVETIQRNVSKPVMDMG